ncbi:hypothetical protein Sxan_74070 [Streptomyces xanthophaeus]|uniref:Uncharacterized protein n=1 Tax=Streptomyces xanthophaeus TaxID=67385 RepID=A0A919H3K2_9ACTN|nr:hypothetical protein Sxan_74070 [Streptomyces xanthophaeus]
MTPGPDPVDSGTRLIPGVTYCGTCIGRRTVRCDYCCGFDYERCRMCKLGRRRCPDCAGGNAQRIRW